MFSAVNVFEQMEKAGIFHPELTIERSFYKVPCMRNDSDCQVSTQGSITGNGVLSMLQPTQHAPLQHIPLYGHKVPAGFRIQWSQTTLIPITSVRDRWVSSDSIDS